MFCGSQEISTGGCVSREGRGQSGSGPLSPRWRKLGPKADDSEHCKGRHRVFRPTFRLHSRRGVHACTKTRSARAGRSSLTVGSKARRREHGRPDSQGQRSAGRVYGGASGIAVTAGRSCRLPVPSRFRLGRRQSQGDQRLPGDSGRLAVSAWPGGSGQAQCPNMRHRVDLTRSDHCG